MMPAELALELYNASQFEASRRGSFLTLMTAIESLAKRERRPDYLCSVIDEWQDQCDKLGGSDASIESEVQSLKNGLRDLKLNSIRRTCLDMIMGLGLKGRYGGESAGEFYKKCYEIRNQLTHSGQGPEGGEVASRAMFLHDLTREIILGTIAKLVADGHAIER